MNWEGEQRPLFSVDVPPSADIYAVYEMLERGENDNVWIFQEGYAHASQGAVVNDAGVSTMRR